MLGGIFQDENLFMLIIVYYFPCKVSPLLFTVVLLFVNTTYTILEAKPEF